MTLCEKIIYISDYIDFTRTYSDCKALREMFWSASPEKMGEREREIHLDRVILTCLEMTVEDLVENSRHVSRETLEARDFILEKLEKI